MTNYPQVNTHTTLRNKPVTLLSACTAPSGKMVKHASHLTWGLRVLFALHSTEIHLHWTLRHWKQLICSIMSNLALDPWIIREPPLPCLKWASFEYFAKIQNETKARQSVRITVAICCIAMAGKTYCTCTTAYSGLTGHAYRCTAWNSEVCTT